MDFRLTLNRDHVDLCRKAAREIAQSMRSYVARFTTTGIETASLYALGVTGKSRGKYLAERVVEKLEASQLAEGAIYWLGSVMVERSCTAEVAALYLLRHGLPKKRPAKMPHAEIRRVTRAALRPYVSLVNAAAQRQHSSGREECVSPEPLLVIETGNQTHDLQAMQEAVEAGFTGVLLRSPISMSGEGLAMKRGSWRGRYDILETLKNSTALAQELGDKKKHPLKIIWGSLHLSAPTVTVAAIPLAVSALEYDALTMSRIGGVHFKRALLDQQFVYGLIARAKKNISVASDRWRSVVEGYSRGYELIMGNMIIEALGELAGNGLAAIRARHGLLLGVDERENRGDRLAVEIAQSQLLRELFPQVPLDFVVDVEENEELLTLGNLLALFCDYAGLILTKPENGKGKRCIPIEMLKRNQRIYNVVGRIGDDIVFTPHGHMNRRAMMLLERASRMFAKLQRRGFMERTSAAKGDGLLDFANSGAGLDGVIRINRYYWNPLVDWIHRRARRR